jgi:hypothetical protein
MDNLKGIIFQGCPQWSFQFMQGFLSSGTLGFYCTKNTPGQRSLRRIFGPRKDRDVYNRSWNGVSISEFIDVLDEHLVLCNKKRIKLSLGAMSLVEYRENLGLAV